MRNAKLSLEFNGGKQDEISRVVTRSPMMHIEFLKKSSLSKQTKALEQIFTH